MTVVSIPEVSNRIAAVCLSTCVRDRFGGQARAGHRGGRSVQCQAGSNSVATHLVSCAGGEYESFSITWLFSAERLEDVYGLTVQRCDAVLATLAVAEHVGTHAQMDVTNLKCGQLADAQPGGDGELEHRVVTPSGPGRAVRRCQQRGDLGVGEVADLGSGMRLGGIARTRPMVSRCSRW